MSDELVETVFHILRPGAVVIESRKVMWPREPGYPALKTLLQAPDILGKDATIEHVTILTQDGKRGDMFVDDDFHRKQLPYNALASAEYQRAAKSRGQPNDYPICGVAVVFRRRVWF